MQGESALSYLLICPEFLDRLLAKNYETEFVILEAVGMGWMACDMPGLTSAERTRRQELVQSLLVYNIVGEAMYMPGGTVDGEVRGVRADHFGGLPAQNLLALVANADARVAFRERHTLPLDGE